MSTISQKKRDPLFDNIRSILIFLVVFGHALEYFRLEDQWGERLYVFIYLFHMPVFIFISGYFSKNLEKGRKTAARTFLIPYLLLNTFLSIILMLAGRMESISILNPGWTLWFLYSMFIWRLMLPDLVRVKHIMLLSFLAAVFSGMLTEFGTYMALARTLGFLPYFLAGYYTTSEHIERIRRLRYGMLLSIVVIITGILTALHWVNIGLPAELLWGDRAYEAFTIPLYQNILADIALMLLAFGFIFAFLILCTRKTHFYTPWGKNTLSIYLLHIYLIAPVIYFTQFIPQHSVRLILLLLASIGVVYFLSLPKVVSAVNHALKKVNDFLMFPEKK